MKDSADPLEGWHIMDILKSAPTAKNDIYGSLHLHIHKTLLQFCTRIKNLDISFTLYHEDATELPPLLGQSGMGKHFFDRIEASYLLNNFKAFSSNVVHLAL